MEGLPPGFLTNLISQYFTSKDEPVPGDVNFGNVLMNLTKFFGEPDDKGYIPGVSETLYNTIQPQSYQGHVGQALKAISSVARGKNTELERSDNWGEEDWQLRRDDAWHTYLGMEQENNTFVKSRYKPTKSTDPEAEYYDFTEPRMGERLIRKKGGVDKVVNWIKEADGPVVVSEGNWFGVGPSGVMGRYTLDHGEDEQGKYISYYDKWDLKKSATLGVKAGKPFELYGRYYYADKEGR